jgi:hypothetical protein
MHKGVLPKEPDKMSPPDTKAKLFPVTLTKNYVPRGEYEVVGYLKEAVKRKDAAGNWRIVEKEEFIKGEMRPHNSPGVGFGAMEMKDGTMVNAKIWAGTQIRVPVDEAKYVVSKKIAERADDIAA